VRKGDYHGWRCNEAMADVTTFREVRIPGELPSVLATAAATGFYLGPVPKTAAHATLLKLLGGVAVEIAATPVRVEGKLAMIVLLDDLGDSMLATKRAEELGRLAGEALGRIVQRDKQS
jgi:predicted DNA repair protein MutK